MTNASTTHKPNRPVAESLFATVLGNLINQTAIFSRSEWATALGVTTAAISQWLNDKTVPRARTLRSLIDIVRRYRGADDFHLQAFFNIVDHPAHTVSPHGDRLGASVGRYLLSPVLEGFLRQLDTLSHSISETILLNALTECERLREQTERSAKDDNVPSETSPTSVQSSSWPLKNEPFIGRDTELMQVCNSLSEGTLVAVLGATGAGKTALAAEVIRRSFGSAPCEAIKRFEFKKSYELPWDELRRYVRKSDSERRDELRTDRTAPIWHENVLFVFDDVDMAQRHQQDELALFLKECSNVGPRLRIILTYGSERSGDIQSLLSGMGDERQLAAVYLARLSNTAISQLWISFLTGLARAWSPDSVRFATWFAAGSPGYCRHLAECATGFVAKGLPVTEYGVVEASRILLNDTHSGVAARQALNEISHGAQSVALWSAMQDLPVGIEEAGLPKFYQEVRESSTNVPDELNLAIAEASDKGLIERVNIGERLAIRLRNESHRPHFRAVALNRFRQVQPVRESTQDPASSKIFETASTG